MTLIRSWVCLVPALLGGQGIKLAAGDPVVRLRGSLCPSQGLCYIPASDPAPASGSSSQAPQSLRMAVIRPPGTSLCCGVSYRAGSQQACSECDLCPPFHFGEQPSGTNSLGQAACQCTNGSSIRDGWKGHLGSGTRLSALSWRSGLPN